MLARPLTPLLRLLRKPPSRRVGNLQCSTDRNSPARFLRSRSEEQAADEVLPEPFLEDQPEPIQAAECSQNSWLLYQLALCVKGFLRCALMYGLEASPPPQPKVEETEPRKVEELVAAITPSLTDSCCGCVLTVSCAQTRALCLTYTEILPLPLQQHSEGARARAEGKWDSSDGLPYWLVLQC
eukprot:5998504-Amphidinium_carterae.2